MALPEWIDANPPLSRRQGSRHTSVLVRRWVTPPQPTGVLTSFLSLASPMSVGVMPPFMDAYACGLSHRRMFSLGRNL